MTKIEFQNLFREALKKQNDLSEGQGPLQANFEESSGQTASFSETLKEAVNSVDESQKNADQMASHIASGKTENIHETMLALSQAELSFNLMVQVRNRALEAYQEVMRMPV
ncbi:MAG: flagellar hook-basal body complex protein FliE [Oligoflexales bacterium]